MSFSVRRHLPHLLVGVSISLIMVVAYASVGLASSTVPKATWSANPVTITFAAATGHGSNTDLFTCSPSATGVTLQAKVATSRVSLSVAPTSFSSCGPSPDSITLKASCLVSASLCRGIYSGLVQIRQPANYRDIPANLPVKLVVT